MPTVSIPPITRCRISTRRATPADLADAEIKLTTTVITYAHHASIGRVHWSRVSADIDYTATAPEPADVLAAMVGANDVAAALDAYEPHTPGYLALKAKLAEIRAGKVERPKRRSRMDRCSKSACRTTACRQLRERLGVLGDGGTTYDKPVADAVKKFQQEHQIAATGTLTAATVEALNGKTARSPGRHHPRQYGTLALDAAPASATPTSSSICPITRCA